MIPICPKCGPEIAVVPSRLMPNGCGGGRALSCAACGEGVPATREQIAEVERRERHWREAETRQEADHLRGVKASLDVYLAQIEVEERPAKRREQLALFGGRE